MLVMTSIVFQTGGTIVLYQIIASYRQSDFVLPREATNTTLALAHDED